MSQKKLCVKLVTYQNYTKMHGPKNIKKDNFIITQMCISDWCNQIQTTPKTRVCYHIHLRVEIYRNTLKRILSAHL